MWNPRIGLLPEQVLVRVNKIIMHPRYNSKRGPEYDFDIALLHIILEDRVELTRNIRTICLPDPDRSKYTGPNVTGGESCCKVSVICALTFVKVIPE